ncbi:MAG: hypothetical protein K2R93_12470 [Gemmatimonadaceae bacterium]|nr:hypothetical protein [Gemmatimonadaceae bacterium]
MIGAGWSQQVARTIESAKLFALGGYRHAHTFVGSRPVRPINTQSTYIGEVESAIARGRRVIASSKALVNTPGVTLPQIDTTAYTQLIGYAWEPPNYVGQSWRSTDASTVDYVGYQTVAAGLNEYFAGSYCGYGGDYQLAAHVRVGGTYYTNAYAEVGYGTGNAPAGPLVVASRWVSGVALTVQAHDASGRVWKRGTISSTVGVSGTANFSGAYPHRLCGTSTPDADLGSLIPTLFVGLWTRVLSDAELSALVREACAFSKRPNLLGLPATYAPRVAATDSLKLRANTNGARALFTLG